MRWLTLQQLKSKNPATRLQMVQKLTDSDDEDAVEALINVLADEDLEVRKAAAKGLGKLKTELAVESLIASLRDPQPEMRQIVTGALKAIGDKRATTPLVSLLRDDNPNVRYHAISALESLNWNPRDDAERAMRCVASGKLNQAVNYGGAAIDALSFELRTGVHYKRIEAVEALGKITDARVAKPLIGALRDEDANVRAKAVEVLARIGDARAVDPLIGALKDRDSRVRATAVEALTKIGDARAVQALTNLLQDSSPEVRTAAAEALGKMKDPVAVEALMNMLKDSDGDIRHISVVALGKIGDSRAIGSLVAALIDKSENVRQAAEAALPKIDVHWEKSSEAMRAVPILESAVQSKEYWVRQAATGVLKRVAGESILPTAEDEEITTVTDRAQQRRRDAAQLFVALLRDSDRDLRLAAAEALREIGNKNSVTALIEALGDPDQWVRRASAKSLQALKWEATDDGQKAFLFAALKNWNELISLGAFAVHPLIFLLRDPVTRNAAMDTLAKIRDVDVTEPLMEALNDPDKNVRKAVAKTLMALGHDKLNEAQRFIVGTELAS